MHLQQIGAVRNIMTNDIKSCHEVWEEMNYLLTNSKLIRNYSQNIDMSDYTVATELFPIEALVVYSAWNLEDPIDENDRLKYFSAHRGGSQGDYRDGMAKKIANVVDCLLKFPKSKRAVITVPNNPTPVHSSDDDAKCMREIHFYLDEVGEERILSATVWMCAQAAEIFPKNIHFVGSLMDRVAQGLADNGFKGVKVGSLFYLATTLISVRED